ncbi:DedA family protein [Patescibacteria group bacterium]|nr:DedA family protein [Patescibacteria group bacterium]MDE2021424.1 DedA family protein [Patescibacteria group bacterium]MDE2173005.1 DedA family protein [Patescibacteria group bacterium]
MFSFTFLSHFIGGAAGSTITLSLAIILGTFILEDPTTVLVGVLAADGIISVPVALFSLYAGIVLGDTGLYCLGWLASTHPRLARYVDHEFLVPFRTWLESRYVLTVFSARFIPGSRLPTYTASGFFRSPLSTFVLTAIVATSIWTTLLFYASYWFGNFTSSWLGPIRWGVAILFLIVLFLIGRRNLLAYRAKKNGDTVDDIRGG